MGRLRTAGTVAAAITAMAVTATLGSAPTSAAPTAEGGHLASAPPKRPACGGERPVKPTGGRYTCTMDDDFNGSAVDGSKWVVQETALSGVSAAGTDCYVNSPANVRVASGMLSLTAREEAAPFVCKSPYGDFTATRTAATVGGFGRFTQTYGRFEFRAKFPDTAIAGVHSALWLYPQRHTYGGWPKSGEIDVAEWFSGAPSHVYPSVHYSGENVLLSTGYNCPVAGAGQQFHRYAVEWTPTVMRFLYDGRLCFSHSWTPDNVTGSAPFDQPFYLVMTQVFGEGWNQVTADTVRSATTLVDWVRVWQ